MIRLDAAHWRAEADRHAAVVDAELADVVHRRDRGQKHPIDDFLFHYYNLRPNQLRLWHPGLGVALHAADDYAERPFAPRVDGAVGLDVEALLAKRGGTVATAHRLLLASARATPRFGCFGMHEWAMVYRLEPGETRHPYLKLRFPPDELASVVEEVGCRCSHFDAFRFFTGPAVPLNLFTPSRQQQVVLDQPGGLHVNMDLYKWAGMLRPAIDSALLLDTFRLARAIRVVDMRASAYDLTDWGYEPIKVETPEGRAEYAGLQRGFAAAAAPLRERLLNVLGELVNRKGVLARITS